MKIEKFLDRRISVKEGEASLSTQARERVFQKQIGPVAIPATDIEKIASKQVGHYRVSRYVLHTKTGSKIFEEHEVDDMVEVVDKSIIGPPERKYDEVFSELRTQEARARYERVRKYGQRIRFAGALAIAATAGALVGISNGPTPTIVRADSCELSRGPHDKEYLEKAPEDSSQYDEHQRCSVNGQEYIIRQNIAE